MLQCRVGTRPKISLKLWRVVKSKAGVSSDILLISDCGHEEHPNIQMSSNVHNNEIHQARRLVFDNYRRCLVNWMYLLLFVGLGYGLGCLELCECLNDAYCNPINGSCSCTPGWLGTHCDMPCLEGYFGNGCTHICTCQNGATCDHVTGDCLCAPGMGLLLLYISNHTCGRFDKVIKFIARQIFTVTIVICIVTSHLISS